MNSRNRRSADRSMLAALAAQARKRRDGWSDLEVEFFNRLQQFAPRAPLPEHDARVIETRKWRGDFVWRAQRVIVEIEGGVYVQGRHTRGRGYEGDCEKYNTLTVLGWRILRFTRRMLRDDPIGCISLVQSLVEPLAISEMADNGGFQD